MEKWTKSEKYIKIAFVILMTLLCFVWSFSQPFGSAPDEGMKMDICRYIVENNKLPHGGDEAVRHPVWGISYGFTPIFAYMISAVFMKFIMIFTANELAILVAARLTSVLCYMGTVIMVMKIAEKLFSGIYKWVFIILISALPQLVFLGTYINNDSLAIFSTAIIVYSWIIGLKNKWNIKSCITMAVGLGLCALSYYNAYGFILVSIIVYIASNFIEYGKKIDVKEFFKKGLIIFAVSFLIAGWWFIRSAIIYEGDFLGLATTDEYAEKYAIEEYKPSKRMTPYKGNCSLPFMIVKQNWGFTTYMSFMGLFGNMEITMYYIYYYGTLVFFFITMIGVLVYLWKFAKKMRREKTKENYKEMLWTVSFVLCIVIPICLSLYYSYYSDFQPQGRYIMPMLIPFMYFVTIGIKTICEEGMNRISLLRKTKNVLLILFCIIWSIIPFISLFNVVIPFYKV